MDITGVPIPQELHPRKNPRQSRAQATVDAILEATAHILAKRGYDGMTTNHVAERAGVSIGSLYQYYPSKESLVAALLQKNAEDNLRTLQQAIDRAAGLPLVQALEVLIDDFLELHATNPQHHAVLIDGAPQIGILEWERTSTKDNLGVLADFLSTYSDEFRPGLDLPLALTVLAAMTRSIFDRLVVHDPAGLKSDAIRREILMVIIVYLTGRAPGPRSDAAD
ncbi:putative TetR family transcriptional regulator [Sphingobium sp. SYK-6]|nr:putative TetR family transcriptional regulator [Sphingobium sp. SYK-6]